MSDRHKRGEVARDDSADLTSYTGPRSVNLDEPPQQQRQSVSRYQTVSQTTQVLELSGAPSQLGGTHSQGGVSSEQESTGSAIIDDGSETYVDVQKALFDVLQSKPVLNAALLQALVPKEPVRTRLPVWDESELEKWFNTDQSTSTVAARSKSRWVLPHHILGTLQSKQVLEVIGEQQSGKLHHLYQIAAAVTLPRVWRGIEYNGQAESILWIDCGYKFDLTRFVEILLARIRQCNLEAKIQEQAQPSTIQELEAQLVEHALRRIRLVQPQTPNELLTALAHIDTAVEGTTVFEEAEEVSIEDLEGTDIKMHTKRSREGASDTLQASGYVSSSKGQEVLLPVALTDPVSTPRLIFLSDLHTFYWERRSVQQGFAFYDAVARSLMQRMQQQGVAVVMTSTPLFRRQSSELTNSLLDPAIADVIRWQPLFSISDTQSHPLSTATTTYLTRFQPTALDSIYDSASRDTSIFSNQPYRSPYGANFAKLVTSRVYLRPVTTVDPETRATTSAYLAVCTGTSSNTSSQTMSEGETSATSTRLWSFYFYTIDQTGIRHLKV